MFLWWTALTETQFREASKLAWESDDELDFNQKVKIMVLSWNFQYYLYYPFMDRFFFNEPDFLFKSNISVLESALWAEVNSLMLSVRVNTCID